MAEQPKKKKKSRHGPVGSAKYKKWMQRNVEFRARMAAAARKPVVVVVDTDGDGERADMHSLIHVISPLHLQGVIYWCSNICEAGSKVNQRKLGRAATASRLRDKEIAKNRVREMSLYDLRLLKEDKKYVDFEVYKLYQPLTDLRASATWLVVQTVGQELKLSEEDMAVIYKEAVASFRVFKLLGRNQGYKINIDGAARREFMSIFLDRKVLASEKDDNVVLGVGGLMCYYLVLEYKSVMRARED